MDTFNTILFVVLILLILMETIVIRQFNKKEEALQSFGKSIQEAFTAVGTENMINSQSFQLLQERIDAHEASIKLLSGNDALIAVYLEMFRDGMSINKELYNKVGSIKFPEPEN